MYSRGEAWGLSLVTATGFRMFRHGCLATPPSPPVTCLSPFTASFPPPLLLPRPGHSPCLSKWEGTKDQGLMAMGPWSFVPSHLLKHRLTRVSSPPAMPEAAPALPFACVTSQPPLLLLPCFIGAEWVASQAVFVEPPWESLCQGSDWCPN